MKKIGKIFTTQFTINKGAQQRIADIIEESRDGLTRLAVQTNGFATAKYEQGTHDQWPIAEYVGMVAVMLNEITGKVKPVRYWFLGLDKGGRVLSHNHYQSDWSAVFYPMSTRNDEGGEIVFEDGTTIRPHAGLAVFFPGTLKHRVMPYNGESTRLSVAFNRDTEGKVNSRE